MPSNAARSRLRPQDFGDRGLFRLRGDTRVGPHVRRVLVAEVVQAHRLLDMLEVVQVREWQAVDLPAGSAVLMEHVVVEPTAPHGELVLRVREGRGPGGTVLDRV